MLPKSLGMSDSEIHGVRDCHGEFRGDECPLEQAFCLHSSPRNSPWHLWLLGFLSLTHPRTLATLLPYCPTPCQILELTLKVCNRRFFKRISNLKQKWVRILNFRNIKRGITEKIYFIFVYIMTKFWKYEKFDRFFVICTQNTKNNPIVLYIF